MSQILRTYKNIPSSDLTKVRSIGEKNSGQLVRQYMSQNSLAIPKHMYKNFYKLWVLTKHFSETAIENKILVIHI